MSLAHTRALITGGVSGLGLAVAQHLVVQGAKVALFDLNDEKGAAAVAQLGAANASYQRVDVSDEAAVAAAVAAASDAMGGLNAAIRRRARTWQEAPARVGAQGISQGVEAPWPTSRSTSEARSSTPSSKARTRR